MAVLREQLDKRTVQHLQKKSVEHV